MVDLRFHDLRHEATSRLFEKGLNVMEVAAITGHKTLDMLKRYTHLRAEDLAKKLACLLGRSNVVKYNSRYGNTVLKLYQLFPLSYQRAGFSFFCERLIKSTAFDAMKNTMSELSLDWR